MAQSGMGKIILKDDFCGPEIPVALTTAAPLFIGPFKILGDLAETDTGVVAVAKTGGWVRISGNDEDGKGVAIATETVMTAASNGTLIAEARVELPALTARNAFFGFSALAADDIAEPVTGSTVTLTLTPDHLAGFVLDSQLTAGTVWHLPYKGGTTSGPTASTSVTSGIAAVAAEADILRIEIDPNGTTRWYVNGVLEQNVVGAVSPTALLAVVCGVWGTTTTAADMDVDYLYVEFNRDWTR